jgi:hypothetical protein
MAEVTGEFGEAYPAIALTRLKHLAVGPEPEITAMVVSALGRIVASMNVSDFLRTMTSWLREPEPTRTGIVAVAVADAIANADIGRSLLDADESTLIWFWRAALSSLPGDAAARLIQTWLRSGAGAESPGRDAVGVLLEATEGDLRRIGQLLYATRPSGGHLADDDPLAELFGRVRIRLDELTIRNAQPEQEF